MLDLQRLDIDDRQHAAARLPARSPWTSCPPTYRRPPARVGVPVEAEANWTLPASLSSPSAPTRTLCSTPSTVTT